jgi:hypothetical protein
MDRRDALKKLGMGGATVLGASVIVSSPAFAYRAPFDIVAMTFNAPTLSGTTTTCTVTAGGAQCPGSATPPSATFLISATVTTVTVSGANRRFNLNGTTANTASPGQSTSSSGSDLTFTVIKTNNGGTAEVPATNDQFSVSITIVYTCTYSDGTTRTANDTLTRNWRYNGTAWVQA